MKVKPMIFNTEMVKAILAGKKTVTRRPAKVDYERGMNGPVIRGSNGEVSVLSFAPVARLCPFGNVGDLIYVRETFSHQPCANAPELTVYKAGYPQPELLSRYESVMPENDIKWTPSIHMPRHASRLTLKVTDVRIERVHSMNRGDCMSEGCPFPNMKDGKDPFAWFIDLWDSIYQNWKENPYVWVIEFEVIHKNVDKYLSEIGHGK